MYSQHCREYLLIWPAIWSDWQGLLRAWPMYIFDKHNLICIMGLPIVGSDLKGHRKWCFARNSVSEVWTQRFQQLTWFMTWHTLLVFTYLFDNLPLLSADPTRRVRVICRKDYFDAQCSLLQYDGKICVTVRWRAVHGTNVNHVAGALAGALALWKLPCWCMISMKSRQFLTPSSQRCSTLG